MLTLRIIDINFNLIDEISQYESLQLTRKHHEIGNVELKINRYIRGANELIRDRIIFPGNQLHKAYQIKHREIELDENGKQTENWLIKAVPLKSWLSQRLILPPANKSNDEIKAPAETVMKHYVDVSVVNPVDANRKIPNLVIANDKQRGDEISRSARFDVISEELITESQLTGLGWNIIVDIKKKQFVFYVVEGVNRSATQRDNPPVIFSPEFNSLKSMGYTESYLDYKNMAYVAGQGEGVDRRVITISESASGLDRYELFVDARDIEETSTDDAGNETPRSAADIEVDLTNRGNENLSEHSQEIYMEGQILTKSPFIYERDWDLGDIVTIQNKDWGITMDARITEVKEIYEAGNSKRIEVVFDKDKPTFMNLIKRQFKNMRPLIKQ